MPLVRYARVRPGRPVGAGVSEVPWFAGPPDATLAWSEPGVLGHLHFVDPNGERTAIPVTEGSQTRFQTDDGTGGSPIWHVDVAGDSVTVSPSIHYVGRWHSPNPVRFRLVDSLD